MSFSGDFLNVPLEKVVETLDDDKLQDLSVAMHIVQSIYLMTDCEEAQAFLEPLGTVQDEVFHRYVTADCDAYRRFGLLQHFLFGTNDSESGSGKSSLPT